VHLTLRGRLVLLVLVALLATVAMVFGRGQVAATSSSQQVVHYVTVEPGDTLWQIARRAAPQSDPRLVVDRIVEINGLDGAAIQAGSRLAVPLSR
jgi:hypothetical protein